MFTNLRILDPFYTSNFFRPSQKKIQKKKFFGGLGCKHLLKKKGRTLHISLRSIRREGVIQNLTEVNIREDSYDNCIICLTV